MATQPEVGALLQYFLLPRSANLKNSLKFVKVSPQIKLKFLQNILHYFTGFWFLMPILKSSF